MLMKQCELLFNEKYNNLCTIEDFFFLWNAKFQYKLYLVHKNHLFSYVRSVGACLWARYKNTIDDSADTKKMTSNHLW